MIGAGLVLFQPNGRDGFLAVRRPDGKIGLPGGKREIIPVHIPGLGRCERPETHREAALREFHEETGCLSPVPLEYAPFFQEENVAVFAVRPLALIFGEEVVRGMLDGGCLIASETDLCDDNIAAFAAYNRRMFDAIR